MELILFILTYFLFAFNVIGYGNIFAKKILSYNKKTNIGYIGIYGIFALTLISYISNLFVEHNYFHNLIILILGIIFFIQYIFSIKNFRNNKDIKYLGFFLLISIFAILYFKSHDDFLYYHLSFIHNLTINKVEFGLGNFDLAFNHVSSLFFFHSLFSLPFTGDYFYFIGPVLIMVFSNIILVKNILEDNKKLSFNFFLKLFIFIFINVFFYRLAEHGTDRSAIILILLSISLIFEIFDSKNLNHTIFENLILLLTLIVSMKSFYAIYGLLFLVIYFRYFTISQVSYFYKKFKILNISIVFAFLILFYNVAYTGCLIYPVPFTCFESFYWSMDISRIEWAASFYELWSKAGATPNYRVENPDEYIKGLNWMSVWLNNYFFNKVSDTLIGLLVTVSVFIIIFKPQINKFKYIKKYNLIFIILLIYLTEWFLNHPSLRYGGYHLVALLFFLPVSMLLGSQKYSYSKNLKKIQIVLLIGFIIFSYRNIDRIINEYKVYNYNPVKSPLYRLEEKDYYMKRIKKDVFMKTNNCKSKTEKIHNCKIINSYKFFY